jgi:hypothetical protein
MAHGLGFHRCDLIAVVVQSQTKGMIAVFQFNPHMTVGSDQAQAAAEYA